MTTTPRPVTTTRNERFHLLDSPSTGAKILSKHATREEADEALRAKVEASPGVNFTVVDTGVQGEVSPKEKTEHVEAGMTAEQKALAKKAQEDRLPEKG